jgi:tungstate transport system ATP-binding protein
MSDPALYDLINLRYDYNRKFVLDVSRLTIGQGASIGIVGPNGCGKSTLLKILAFLELNYTGDLYYKGDRITRKKAHACKEVTLLLQEPYLLKRSVFENVAFGLRIRGKTDKLHERVDQAIAWVGLSYREFAKRKWFELSGGEAKRVALASRLILLPGVLILDEPTANIDRESAAHIKEAIRIIRAQNTMSLIIASHDMDWLSDITNTVLNLREGKLIG